MSEYKIILYADDDSDDKMWISEAGKTIEDSLQIRFVDNGREVLDYLTASSAEDFPSVIVLDLNMPELDGRQTLQRLKAHALYKDIPVVIVTTSSSKIDKDICQRLGASLYLTKPDTHLEWQNIVRQLQPYIT